MDSKPAEADSVCNPAATADPVSAPDHADAASSAAQDTAATANTATLVDSSVSGPKKFRDASKAPLRKLSVDLIRTYKYINTVYYAAKRAKKKEPTGTNNDGYDDENHDYIIRPGEVFYERYEIKQLLGKGSFGQVCEAYDNKERKKVAVKIIKNKTAFRNQAKIEIKLLQEMNSRDPEDKYHIVRMINFFEHRHHLCLVFELLSFNLYELIKHTQYKGVSLNLIRRLGKQLLQSLDYLSSPDIAVIHCDLKPENILLEQAQRSDIKIIDFGSSCKIGKTMYPYIQSRFYRSPEVLLNIPYNQAIDMWSLGCILYELHTGDPLFNGNSEVDQMMKITEVLGMPPEHMLEKGQKTKRYFKRDDEAVAYERIKTEKEYKPMLSRRVADLIGSSTDGPRGLRRGEIGHTKANYDQFEDLLLKLLVYDPALRLKPADALQHDFFRNPAHLAVTKTSGDEIATSTTTTTTEAARADESSPDMFKETASKKHAGSATTAAPPAAATVARKPVAEKATVANALPRQTSRRLSGDARSGRRSV